MNGPFLGSVPIFQAAAMPGAPDKRVLKDVITTVLMDKLFLGAAIDARIAEAVKKASLSSTSGGINASSVDSKIAKALEGVDSKVAEAVKRAGVDAATVDAKIAKAVEGRLTASNLGKMRLAPASGGGRRASKRGRGKKRGTKRR
jgi:hypothetical protein